MLTTNKIMAFVPTVDLRRARHFYEEKLGMKVLYQDDFALALVSRGVMIRVTLVQDLKPQPFTVFGWEVPSIARAMKQLKSKHIHFNQYGIPGQDESGLWQAPGGARIAWFNDPDGNVLSLCQFATSNRKPQSKAKTHAAKAGKR